jgi:hypothetical protein
VIEFFLPRRGQRFAGDEKLRAFEASAACRLVMP